MRMIILATIAVFLSGCQAESLKDAPKVSIKASAKPHKAKVAMKIAKPKQSLIVVSPPKVPATVDLKTKAAITTETIKVEPAAPDVDCTKVLDLTAEQAVKCGVDAGKTLLKSVQ